MDRPINVLFLCTGNSARSIMAEAILNTLGHGRFTGHSGGAHPKGSLNPMAIDLLTQMKISTEGLRCKNWDEFAKPGAVEMDYVFTVCDDAAGEVCPAWPGTPITAHWGIPDPAKADGSDAMRMLAFRDAFRMLERRIQLLLALRHRELSRAESQKKVVEIGRVRADSAEHKAS